MAQKPVKVLDKLSEKICVECGQVIKEQVESYFMECDRCLAKKVAD